MISVGRISTDTMVYESHLVLRLRSGERVKGTEVPSDPFPPVSSTTPQEVSTLVDNLVLKVPTFTRPNRRLHITTSVLDAFLSLDPSVFTMSKSSIPCVFVDQSFHSRFVLVGLTISHGQCDFVRRPTIRIHEGCPVPYDNPRESGTTLFRSLIFNRLLLSCFSYL